MPSQWDVKWRLICCLMHLVGLWWFLPYARHAHGFGLRDVLRLCSKNFQGQEKTPHCTPVPEVSFWRWEWTAVFSADSGTQKGKGFSSKGWEETHFETHVSRLFQFALCNPLGKPAWGCRSPSFLYKRLPMFFRDPGIILQSIPQKQLAGQTYDLI